ncbi:MAG: peptide chain release factor N(5)-glutamine methyltransferase [bacterium]|jgi:release factor glutamine methyltransferase
MTTGFTTVAEALAWATACLAAEGIPAARLDAEVLLSHVLTTDRSRFYIYPDAAVPPAAARRYREIVAARAARRPLQYLTDRQEFMGIDFAVNEHVLIPRPETEILVEAVCAEIGMRQAPLLADVGTGSGAIAVSLAKFLPDATIYALDISAAALALAGRNAAAAGVGARVFCLAGDLLDPLQDRGLAGALAGIVANPPYIPTGDIADLAPEVRDWEPRLALDGGKDGMEYYRRLVAAAPPYLTADGFLAVEIGAGQADAVAELFAASGVFTVIRRRRDYAGWERVIIGRKQPGNPAC